MDILPYTSLSAESGSKFKPWLFPSVLIAPAANYRHISSKSLAEVKAKAGKSGILWEQMLVKSSYFSSI